jgi:peptidoglycan/xylan/chitin deacetylase (PgdA/CDA1 family)/SAM-dependent methyltransferase
VREGVIGRPAGDGTSLRARLAEAAVRAAYDGRDSAGPSIARGGRATEEDSRTPASRAPAGLSLAPGWQAEAARALNGHRAARLIARRREARTGLSGSRMAVFPRAAGADVVTAARTAGDPVIEVGTPGPDAPVFYVPGIVWHAASASQSALGGPVGEGRPDKHDTGRAYFETLFAAGPDPWSYTSPYEQGKYEQTLSLVEPPAPARALEFACAEGHFTLQLAPRVGRLLACDVSEIALERARRRCAGVPNVRFAYHDLFSDPIEGRYDLIVCSEVLYYAGDRRRLEHAVQQMARALEPGGRLLSAHANLLVDDPDRPGFDWDLPFGARVIGEAFSAAGLELVEELANPVYRAQAYRRPRRRALRRLRRARPRRAEARLPDKLPTEFEERFRWKGGEPARATGEGPATRELPILMYHRVAPTGGERMREWRLTPDQFEAQLHYLRTAGYRTASLDEWQQAAERHLPLPGRRVMLTFDDGYEDFAEFAYPLMRQYEFGATVFLVSDRVGQANEWDRVYGDLVPLMDWDTIRALDGHGVSFGGHSGSHPMLTALGLDEVVREVSRCRAELVEQLGHAVRAFAYPYGDFDLAVARMVGGCGFEFALTVEGYAASASVPMLTLPRMNVAGTDSFEAFVRMLAPPSR